MQQTGTITARIDAITRIPESHRGTKLPAPKAVKVELTARCDLACFYCATPMRLRSKSDMDFELFKRIAGEMRQNGVQELGLFYLGESMLYPRLAEAIRYAKSIGFPYVFLTTNGRTATFEKVDACVRAGLDSLKFSLNAANREQYKSFTRVDGFDDVLKNIFSARTAIDQCARDSGHRCGLYVSSILYDEEQKMRMSPVLFMLKGIIDEHYWLPLYSQGGLTAGARETKPTAGNRGRVGAMVDALPCWALFTEGHVTYDGKLTGCCFDHNEAFVFGDLNRQGFMAAWNSPAAQKLRQSHLRQDVKNTACEHCIAYAA